MPLPAANQPWPPKTLETVTPTLETWAAWWQGNPENLRRIYSHTTHKTRPSQHAGGIVGTLSRWWWGRPQLTPNQPHSATHVPLAADIAATSANLLFGEHPQILASNDTTQQRLDLVLADQLWSALTGAAEMSAATGGVYLRVSWDTQLRSTPFVTMVNADRAIPMFRHGILREVSFWDVIGQDGTVIYRHVEHHELDSQGNGVTMHALYAGSVTNLGRMLPLSAHSATAPLEAWTNDRGIVTEAVTPGLNVVYVPNSIPEASKAWYNIPQAAGLGAADIDGLEPMLDELDEIYASWIRDIRLGKGRVIVDQSALTMNEPGQGGIFDLDQSVFSPLRTVPGESGSQPLVHPVQFKIRYAEHAATAKEWTEKIVRTAGYAMQSFGDHDSAQMTATEVISRETRSLQTRNKKLLQWRPALTELIVKLLRTDSALFGQNSDTEGVKVVFPDGIVETQRQIAETASLLRSAEAASTATLVAMIHPEWDQQRIDAETQRILDERGTMTDPFTIT